MKPIQLATILFDAEALHTDWDKIPYRVKSKILLEIIKESFILLEQVQSEQMEQNGHIDQTAH